MRHRMNGLASLATLLALLPLTAAHSQTTTAPSGPGTAPAAAPAPATPDWRGLYVGAGGSYSNVSVEVPNDCPPCNWWGEDPQYESGDGDFGLNAHVGLRLHRYVALEVGYLDERSVQWDKNWVYIPDLDNFYRNQVDFTFTMPEASLLLIAPFGGFEAYLRLGAGFWDGTSSQRLVDPDTGERYFRQFNDNGEGFLVGVGFGYTFSPGWHVRMDLQTVTLDSAMLNVREDTSIDTMLLELQYRFGY